MTAEQIKRHANQLEDILRHEINSRATFHGKVAKLSKEQIEVMKDLVFSIIKSMEMSALINCTINELPLEVVYVTLIEAIGGWSKKIDEISMGARGIEKN